MDGVNMDCANIAESVCGMCMHKLSKGKTLTKDELLTYNSALRLLKAVFDSGTDSLYPKDLGKDKPDEGAFAC